MSHIDPFDIAGQEKAVADRKEKHERTQRRDADDLKWLMSDKRGRRVMWRLLETTGVFRNPYAGKEGDTAFRCGVMNVGQMLFADLNVHCPERYALMVTEQSDND